MLKWAERLYLKDDIHDHVLNVKYISFLSRINCMFYCFVLFFVLRKWDIFNNKSNFEEIFLVLAKYWSSDLRVFRFQIIFNERKSGKRIPENWGWEYPQFYLPAQANNYPICESKSIPSSNYSGIYYEIFQYLKPSKFMKIENYNDLLETKFILNFNKKNDYKRSN